MSQLLIGEVVSRLRNLVKGVHPDAFITDRFFYSLVLKHGRWLMRREDRDNKLMAYVSVFQSLELVELVEVDRVEAGCAGLSSGCTIWRTRERLPLFMQGYNGPLIRSITSIDGSVSLQPTTPNQYLAISKQRTFRYNNTRYFWYLDGYLYFPDLGWDAVRIEGIFEEDISQWKCDPSLACLPKQQQRCSIPDYLLAELESHVLRDMAGMLQLPSDPLHDKQTLLR